MFRSRRTSFARETINCHKRSKRKAEKADFLLLLWVGRRGREDEWHQDSRAPTRQGFLPLLWKPFNNASLVPLTSIVQFFITFRHQISAFQNHLFQLICSKKVALIWMLQHESEMFLLLSWVLVKKSPRGLKPAICGKWKLKKLLHQHCEKMPEGLCLTKSSEEFLRHHSKPNMLNTTNHWQDQTKGTSK